MRNRGPSSSGQVLWPAPGGAIAALGSTRLAVLDLSAAGQQPMTTADGRYTLVYNGEITNYLEVRSQLQARGVSFVSSGDTEVLLRAWEAWGPQARGRFEGMYAFAILDRQSATLTLCRDPFGIKPLFIGDLGGQAVAFGSEIASILPFMTHQPRLNWSVAATYLASGAYDDTSETFIEGITHLPPGSMLVIDLKSGHKELVEPDWWPSVRTDESLTFDQAAEGVRHHLTESVRRNLRSDVPVGVALSGGIDSTASAYLARQVEPGLPLRTFSFVAPGSVGDESPWIDVAMSGLDGQWESITSAPEDLIRDLDDVVVSQGEPFASTSIYAQYRVFKLMHDAGIVVSLDGQGGDEVFAGYHGYPGQRMRSLTETRHLIAAMGFLGQWSKWPGRTWRKGAARTAFELLPKRLADAFYDRAIATQPIGVNEATLTERGAKWSANRPVADVGRLSGVRVKAELRASLLQRGMRSLLRHGDRNSMRWSVESRVPYLDRGLITLVLSMPERYLVDPQGTSKAVLRAALRGLVPDAIIDRRDKIGFEAPDTDWLDARRDQLAAIVLQAPPIGFLDSYAVARGIKGVGAAPRIASSPAWRLVNLYRWATLLGVDCQ